MVKAKKLEMEVRTTLVFLLLLTYAQRGCGLHAVLSFRPTAGNISLPQLSNKALQHRTLVDDFT
jgi:hypothetical protein